MQHTFFFKRCNLSVSPQSRCTIFPKYQWWRKCSDPSLRSCTAIKYAQLRVKSWMKELFDMQQTHSCQTHVLLGENLEWFEFWSPSDGTFWAFLHTLRTFIPLTWTRGSKNISIKLRVGVTSGRPLCRQAAPAWTAWCKEMCYCNVPLSTQLAVPLSCHGPVCRCSQQGRRCSPLSAVCYSPNTLARSNLSVSQSGYFTLCSGCSLWMFGWGLCSQSHS